MSAPTPSMRLADSARSPLVRPTTMMTSVTSTATASTVMKVRSGRGSTFCTIMKRIINFCCAQATVNALMLRLLGTLPRVFVSICPGIFAEIDQIRARRLRQREAVCSNGLVHSKLLECNLQLIVIAGPSDVDLPRISGGRRVLPICVSYVGTHLTTRGEILNS